MPLGSWSLISHLKCTALVRAQLGTRAGNVTLVDVIASLVVHQMKARPTIAVESGLSVDTQLRASAVVRFTFVTSAFVDRFVFRFRAVGIFIAHLR